MTRDELVEIATQVYGECDWHESALLHLEAFAKLVAAKEREAIANVFQEMTKNGHPYMIRMTNAIATIIRARGEA